MPEPYVKPRHKRMRGALPEDYQFGDAANLLPWTCPECGRAYVARGDSRAAYVKAAMCCSRRLTSLCATSITPNGLVADADGQ